MEGYIGTIMMCGYTFAPAQWAFCNGATVQISQNAALYSLLGTTFGGNGTSNFLLPDLMGRAPIHFGTASGGSINRVLGQKFGQENITQPQMPVHTHGLAEVQAGKTVTLSTPAVTVNASDAQADVNKPTGSYWAKGWDAVAQTITSCYHNARNVTMASDAVQVSVTPTFSVGNLAVGNAGGATAFAQPSLAVCFVICLYGLFPSRD